jgi:hypothetical protein
MLDLGHDDLRSGEKAFALVAHDTGKVVDMAMGEDDRVDVVGLDAGRRQRGLQPPRCRPEHFVGADAAIKKNELVAGVQHKAIFLDYKSGGRLELACNHAFDGFLGRLRKKRCGGT